MSALSANVVIDKSASTTTYEAAVVSEHGARTKINENGFCYYHPHIRLEKKVTVREGLLGRKKKELTVTVRESCPKCDELDEIEIQTKRLELQERIRSSATKPTTLDAKLKSTQPPQTAVSPSVVRHPEPLISQDSPPPSLSPHSMVTSKEWVDHHGSKALYTGGVDASGVPHGTGTTEYNESGIVYDGDRKHGLKHGHGVLSWPDGCKYEGEWSNDKQKGRGVLTFLTGESYNGEWLEGKKHGHGVWVSASGEKHDGQFKNGTFNGHCTHTWTNGNKFIGEYQNGKMHGAGVMTYANGECCYNGEWRHDHENGRGVLTFPSGESYSGDWLNGKQHGRGVWTSADGSRYIGEFLEGKFYGQGEYTYPSGNCYVGEYWAGKRNGRGLMTYANGEQYSGEWSEDKTHGQGVLTSADGSILYSGPYHNGERVEGPASQ